MNNAIVSLISFRFAELEKHVLRLMGKRTQYIIILNGVRIYDFFRFSPRQNEHLETKIAAKKSANYIHFGGELRRRIYNGLIRISSRNQRNGAALARFLKH